eukprot:TRINITY_DN1858_c0_g1_i3.p1 TRINITY_DN1858_c0_g1~~TRINITY_DN1858_c0_g1_i3.p1  ORF type:complete len:230 (+),score=27.72 TRINITY_DN1858_c0_g1_i3:83-691(+)
MLRSLVGSEMCIRDRYQRRVRGELGQWNLISGHCTNLTRHWRCPMPEGRGGTSDIYPYLPLYELDLALARRSPTFAQISSHPMRVLMIFLPALLVGVIANKLHSRAGGLIAAVAAGGMLGLTRLALAQFLLISSCAAFCLHLASKKPGMFGVAYVLFSLSLGFVTGMLLMRVYLMASFGLPLYHDMLPKFPPYFVSLIEDFI